MHHTQDAALITKQAKVNTMINLETAQQALSNNLEGLAHEIAKEVVESRKSFNSDKAEAGIDPYELATVKEISWSDLEDEMMKIEACLHDAITGGWLGEDQKEVATRFIKLIDVRYDEIEDKLKDMVDQAIVSETKYQLDLLDDGGR